MVHSMSVHFGKWYAWRSKQDKVGTRASSHKPQYGVYFFTLWPGKPSTIPSVTGWSIKNNKFEWYENYAIDAFESQMVLWTGPTEPLWNIVSGPNGRRGIIKNLFLTKLAEQ